MLRDFTLRSVTLRDLGRLDPRAVDLTFRQGRMTALRAAPEGHPGRIFLTPGFRDAHHHLLHHGLLARRCNLGGTTSLDEALSRLEAYAHDRADLPVIWAERWDESRWSERRGPTREAIDRVIPDRPAILRRVCGHQAVLNTPALEEASRRWSDLDPDGRLTEWQAMGLAALWPTPTGELEEALMGAQDAAVAMGITRVSEMGSHRSLEIYSTLARREMLRVDMELFAGPDQIDALSELVATGVFGGRRLALGGIKLFADGSIGTRTAALREPYADGDQTGTLLYQDDALYEHLQRARNADLRVAIHAIGDAALDQVLRQLERLAAEQGMLTPGWARIEHAEMLDDRLLDRAAALDVTISLQPNFVAQWGDEGGLYETALGCARASRMNPFRQVWDRDFAMLFGSDGMPMDPALGLAGATQHPHEASRLTAEEALGVYFGGRAVPRGLWEPEDWWRHGTDGAVLYDGDPIGLTGGDLARVRVLGVLWGGEWVLEPPVELFRSGVIHGD